MNGFVASGKWYRTVRRCALDLPPSFSSSAVPRISRVAAARVPECRALLPPDAAECPKCKGGIAGSVRTAEEHYVAAAEFRRELAGIRSVAARKKREKRAARAQRD